MSTDKSIPEIRYHDPECEGALDGCCEQKSEPRGEKGEDAGVKPLLENLTGMVEHLTKEVSFMRSEIDRMFRHMQERRQLPPMTNPSHNQKAPGEIHDANVGNQTSSAPPRSSNTNRRYKRNKGKRTAIVGELTETALKGVEKMAYLHIYKLQPATEVADITAHLKQHNVEPICCEKLNFKSSALFSSFKVTIPFADLEVVEDPKKWPVDVVVSRFNYKKARPRVKDVATTPQEKKDVATTPQEKKDVATTPKEKKDVATTPREKKDVATTPPEKKDVATTPKEKKDVAIGSSN